MSSIARLLEADGARGITALLGPTNTGKTHRAIERMMGHRSGMMGLPLRLLAREVYDRVVARTSVDQVALVTGEEKIVPHTARYWICTVEAMPLDRPVAFLAVDEIQLAGHRTRGHVFTDRLLHARGVFETWFMGSDIIAPLLQELVPTAVIERQPRLSRLSHSGYRKLGSLKPGTAVVSFSAEGVYALAEKLRRHHGGTAVVLGALSPRTRNAQVAMYQAGEVPCLVATDAIGMGLNLNIEHVAFAQLRKFDGRTGRALLPSEVAQIAGRAGRFRRDGTFGTTSDCVDLSPDVVQAVEEHSFAPLTRLWYRNEDLDFRSANKLVSSLERHAAHPALVRIGDAEDQVTLGKLLQVPGVRDLAHDADGLRMLWEVARVPDFRKTLTEHHVDLLHRVFCYVRQDGELPEDWIAARLHRLDKPAGDIDAIMTRLAHVRTWTYLSHQSRWMADSERWQHTARAIEDRLSDALHEQLTARFVDHRRQIFAAGPAPELTVDEQGVVWARQVRLGTLVGLEVEGLQEHAGTRLDKAVRQVVRPLVQRKLDELLGRLDLVLQADGQVMWQGQRIARWERGPTIDRPVVRVRSFSWLDAADETRLRRSVEAWSQAQVDSVLAPLRRSARGQLRKVGKGLVFVLEQQLGMVARSVVRDHLRGMNEADRKGVARLDVRLGQRAVYLASGIKPATRTARVAMWSVFHRVACERVPDSVVALAAQQPAGGLLSQGFFTVGPLAIRADMLERVLVTLRGHQGPFELPDRVPTWLGCDRDTAAQVVMALGFDAVHHDGDELHFVGRGWGGHRRIRARD